MMKNHTLERLILSWVCTTVFSGTAWYFLRRRKTIPSTWYEKLLSWFNINTVDQEFDIIAEDVRKFGLHRFPLRIQIILYGYYKQAMLGDMPMSEEDYVRSPSLDPSDMNLQKGDAWRQHRGLSKNAAKERYIGIAKYCLESTSLTNESSPLLPDAVKESHTGVRAFSVPMGLEVDNEDVETLKMLDELCLKIHNQDLSGVRSLLTEKPFLANACFPDRITALHIACDRGYLPLVECLIQHGSDLSVVSFDGDTPFDCAKLRSCVDVMNFLKSQ